MTKAGEILDADITPDIYYQVLKQYQSAQLLFESIKLDIFSYLDEPKTATEIASQLGCVEQNMRLLLVALSSCGYIDKLNGYYRNTKTGAEYLSKRSAHYIGHTILFREAMTSLSGIENKVRHNYVKQADIAYDFSTLAEVSVPEMYATGRVDSFITEIKSIFTDLTKQYKMLDLGGGSGILAIEFAKNYSKSKAYVFESPNVAVTTKKIIDKYNMEQSVSVMAGDFNNDELGDSYDLVVASGIMDFATDDLDSFIAKISAALLNSGYFLLIGKYSDTGEYPEENILNWLTGYMNGIKPPPSKNHVDAALGKAHLVTVRPIKSGPFHGFLYKKEV